MAQIPFQNFAFTDPVAAQQAVQMGQLLTLAQAEKDRNLGNYAQEVQRGRTQDMIARRQQAMTQAQMNQQMAEANLNRQARADETNKVLASQEKVAGLNLQGRNDYKSGNEKFDSLAALIDSEDPPTDSEFSALSQGLTPDRILPLKNALMQKRRALGALASESQQLADFWNEKFDAIRTGDDAGFKALKGEFMKDRRANDLLQKDPRWTGFRLLPKYKGPRLDAPPPSDVPGVTSIDDLRSRIGGGSPSRGSLLGVQQIPSTGFIPRQTDFSVPGIAVPTAIPAVNPDDFISTDATPVNRISAPAPAPRIAIPVQEAPRYPTVTPLESPGPRGYSDTDFNVAPMDNGRLQNYLSAPESFIPGYLGLNPDQKAELLRWIARNPEMSHDRILGVMREIQSRPQPQPILR
jgi:uncharacterized membrane protein